MQVCQEPLAGHPDAAEVFRQMQVYRALIPAQASNRDGVTHQPLRAHPALLDVPEVHSVGLPKH
jgi:hypothetical protein